MSLATIDECGGGIPGLSSADGGGGKGGGGAGIRVDTGRTDHVGPFFTFTE